MLAALIAAPFSALLSADPYLKLGLKNGATAAQIRKAFRSQARVLHPDVSDDPEAAIRFQELVQAMDLIQQGSRFAKMSSGPKTETPDGLAADARVTWLVSNNKVILFMQGSKQQPSRSCPGSSKAVCTLSSVAFDTNTRFAAVDVDEMTGDAELRAAVLRHAKASSLPLCYIDSQLVGGPKDIDAMWETGELSRAFGGEQLVEPRELEWGGAWMSEEESSKEPVQRRAHRNLVHGGLEWYVLADDGNWHAEANLYKAREDLRREATVGNAAREQADRERARRSEQQQQQREVEENEEEERGAAEEASAAADADVVGVEEDGEEETATASPIEAVLEYRFKFGQEQWRVRWRDEDDGHGATSWERWELLDTAALRDDASALREKARSDS